MANSNAATGAGAPDDAGDGDADVGDEVDGVLLDDTAATDWLGELASSRRGTLQGRLRLRSSSLFSLRY